ncbi:protein FAR1-RELATED SEQUENCE 5-like [Arachis hypogaea]|uniref:protein FAR1-RELATED SEQUENCE 5-like n=1 Tax=Arachis hypogaea TaxID=3818 RepID=UPI000DECF270
MAIDIDLNTVLMTEGAEEFEQQTDSPNVINQASGDEEVDPEEGMCFSTLEDARAYYYQYTSRTGFVVKIRTTGWETINDQRVVVNQTLHCNRDGYHTFRVKAPKRRKTVASTNCKAHCYLALDKMTGQWRISRVEVSHSHPLNPKLSGMFSANRQLIGGPANLTFTEKDVRNYISRHLRISGDETDPKELLKHFSRMKELNPNFFFEIDVDEDHSIRNVFWADARCRAAWKYFGDVVTFDTTYKTNRYDMPFGSFVGVNHHGMSTLLGCVLLWNEDTHMFADRHMWVPVFFKDEFWAGMRSTQRSESMHSVFDKYLNSKSSLLQFVRQYQNCVIDKEQKELECDAADLRSVSSQYILSRWSKNVSQRHTYIRSSIDMDRSDESMTIFRQLCSDFYNVAQDFVATPDVAAILRDAMDSARQKLKEHKESEDQAAHEAFLEDSKFNSTTYHKH